MKTQTGDRFKFLMSVLVSLIAGILWSSIFEGTFWNWYNTYRWPRTLIILTIIGATGGYWLCTRAAGVTARRDRFKISFFCHLAAYGLTWLTLVVFALLYPPDDWMWMLVYVLWGALVLTTHGLLMRRIKDAPEDIFV